jgi:hypothetical protein
MPSKYHNNSVKVLGGKRWRMPVSLPAVATKRIPLAGLSAADASRFARLALAGITREFPYKPGYVLLSARDAVPPRRWHPAFYGCYDWHSSVHGHWMLVRLLKLFPDLPEAREIRRKVGGNLKRANLEVEATRFKRPEAGSFERMYGWAWLLKLAQEAAASEDPDITAWSRSLKPLVDTVVALYLDFLPRQTYPIRSGLHNNTAFGLGFALDYARAVKHRRLETLIVSRARDYYVGDRGYPAQFEPGGADFLSPALIEADLMRRVLTPAAFRGWLHRFLPQLAANKPRGLLVPATVSDRSDGQLVHLDGLNLSRAWCMRGVAAALAAADPARAVLMRAARAHAKAGLANIESGNYGGEHWLASFAVQLSATPAVTLRTA